jgi:hypothetical protein
MWARLIGLGAYLLGPPITDITRQAWPAGFLLGALFVLAVVVVIRRRSHTSA